MMPKNFYNSKEFMDSLNVLSRENFPIFELKNIEEYEKLSRYGVEEWLNIVREKIKIIENKKIIDPIGNAVYLSPGNTESFDEYALHLMAGKNKPLLEARKNRVIGVLLIDETIQNPHAIIKEKAKIGSTEGRRVYLAIYNFENQIGTSVVVGVEEGQNGRVVTSFVKSGDSHHKNEAVRDFKKNLKTADEILYVEASLSRYLRLASELDASQEDTPLHVAGNKKINISETKVNVSEEKNFPSDLTVKSYGKSQPLENRNRKVISSKENTMSQNRTQEENSQKNQDAMQTNPHFLDRVGDVLTAVQSVVLPTLPTDIEWDIDKMGNLGNVYGFCEPDNLSERYAMISVAPDIPTTIEASLRYTLDADALEPLVRRRLDNPSEHFTSFDHELLSSWLDLENASMLAFSEQYDKDPSVQNLLHDWPMDDFEQDYRLSLNEKREIARKILTIEDNVQQFCRQNGNEEYLDQYHYCKTDIVDDEQHTEIKVTLDFRNGTSGAADICLAYATGSHEYVEPQMVVAKVTAEQLASKDSIHADIVEALDRNIGTQKRTESKDEKLTYADFLELHQNDDNFAENLRNHMENSVDFAKEAFVTEMNAHSYSPQSPQGDFDVCKNFGKLQDNSSPKFEQGKSAQSYLKDMGYSQNVCEAYEDAKKHVALQDKARDALNFENVLDTWARDCAENNFSEKGTWALCVDVSARMAFKDFSPGKTLSPIDQDTVIVSFYKPTETPKDAKELSAKMDAIKREAVWNTTEVLVNRQKQQEAREMVQEQKQEEKRGMRM